MLYGILLSLLLGLVLWFFLNIYLTHKIIVSPWEIFKQFNSNSIKKWTRGESLIMGWDSRASGIYWNNVIMQNTHHDNRHHSFNSEWDSSNQKSDPMKLLKEFESDLPQIRVTYSHINWVKRPFPDWYTIILTSVYCRKKVKSNWKNVS